MNSIPEPFLTLEHVSIRIPTGLVFEDTNWEILCGQQWAVVGPNGSGKSTLLKGIFGRIPVVRGRILYHFATKGSPVPESPEGIRHLMDCVSSEHGKIPAIQGSGFYQARWSSFSDDDPMLVSEFISRKPARALNRTGEGSPTQTERCSSGMGIEDLLAKRMITLSDGELRRVMIAEALIKRPRLLVLENPFAGLDTENKRRLSESIGRSGMEGTTLILASTESRDIPGCVTHVLLVDHNRVIAQGPKAEILARSRAPIPRRPHTTKIRKRSDDVPAGPALLQLQDVCVSYDSKRILDKVTWEVRKGEHWALLGPNGAGKTTLLSLILGDNPQAYANRITLFGMRRGSGETIWDIKARVGWVSPELHLYYPRRFSCLEVVCSGFFDSIGLHRQVSENRRRHAETLMSRFGIADLGKKGFNAVSYGEQRLVLLARALVKDPPLLVLDEPCQGLDGPHRDLFLGTVNHLGEQGETAIIFVTHEREELPRILTHALLLREGRVVDKGRIEEVLGPGQDTGVDRIEAKVRPKGPGL
jgi:molybdate transport system ATP-binding protein